MNQLLSASLLILLTAGLRLALGRRISCRLRYALWLPVLLRLLIPGTFLPLPASAALPADAPAPVAEWTAAPLPEPSAVPDGETSPAVSSPAAPSAETVLLAVWGVGAAAVGLAFLASGIRFARRLRRDRAALTVPDSRLPVYVTGAAASPCLFGFLRPAIYLTPDAAADPDVCRDSGKLLKCGLGGTVVGDGNLAGSDDLVQHHDVLHKTSC